MVVPRLESESARWVSSSPNSSWSQLCRWSWLVSSVFTAWSWPSSSCREVPIFPLSHCHQLLWQGRIRAPCLRTLLRVQLTGTFKVIQAAGLSIGIVGDAGVRANAQQDKIFVGMILILIFGEALALYGLIVSLILTSQWSTWFIASSLSLIAGERQASGLSFSSCSSFESISRKIWRQIRSFRGRCWCAWSGYFTWM